MKTSRTTGDKERLYETAHYIINLLYLAIQERKEQRKHHRDTNPVHQEPVICTLMITGREEHNTSEMGPPGSVKSKWDCPVME